MDRQSWVCVRLRNLGFEKERHIRLYGKDLRLTSNPVIDQDGYSVEAIEGKSGEVHRMHIPLMVVRVVEEEAIRYEDSFETEESLVA
jgi:hypothetical protein